MTVLYDLFNVSLVLDIYPVIFTLIRSVVVDVGLARLLYYVRDMDGALFTFRCLFSVSENDHHYTIQATEQSIYAIMYELLILLL